MNLNELHKSTIKSFIKKREQQAEIAAAHSQTAKKAWLGNSRETGWRDPIVPRVVGQIGKIGQHNDALLQTATIFNQRYERAKASADKAKLRLLRKPAATMKNEEVVTEGKWLDRLKKLGIVAGMTAFGGGVGIARHNTYTDKTGTHIVDGSAVPAGVAGGLGGGVIGSLMARDMVTSSKRNRNVKKNLKKSKETKDMQNEEYTQVLEQMILSLTGMELEELHEAVGSHLSEDYQTPARNAQMQDMYDRAEGKFMNNLHKYPWEDNLRTNAAAVKMWNIDNKSQKEIGSPRLYGKNGKIIKKTKK